MMNREVEVLAVGAGPANLALAVAIEEFAFDSLAGDTLVIERGQMVGWQQGLLMPWTKSQVAFAKDLVTLRNPRSAFSFLNYLRSVGRLDDFINMGNFLPYRQEVSGYLRWVSESLQRVRVETGCECVSIEPLRNSSGTITGWLTWLADGSSITSRYLVIGIGRDPYVPPELAGLPADRLIHSTQYRARVSTLPKDPPHRIMVVGAAQSAAEMFQSVQHDLPNSDLTWVLRSIGLRAYDTNKFTNELYYPSFVDTFFEARGEGKAQILQEMHRTNYSRVERDLLESLYADLYLDRLSDVNRKRLVTMTDITAGEFDGDEVVIELTDRGTGAVTELQCDMVLLGTGFVRAMPALIRNLGASIGLDRIAVTRQYRLLVDEPTDAACYLQGVNEATHGIADSLLSVLAHRSADIAQDILSHRAANGTGAAVAAPGRLVPGSADR
jgi:L-ornithine N5-oxygenase